MKKNKKINKIFVDFLILANRFLTEIIQIEIQEKNSKNSKKLKETESVSISTLLLNNIQDILVVMAKNRVGKFLHLNNMCDFKDSN